MRIIQSLIIIGFAVTLLGCYEKETTIEIREDGSVRLHDVTHLSERLVVATQEDEERSPTIVSEEKMRSTLESLGGRIERLSSTQREDGSVVLEAIAEFDTPADFFFSDYAREVFSINLTKESEDTARLHLGQEMKSPNMELSLRQLYGFAKGMYLKWTVQLPSQIVESSDASLVGKRTASLEFDLRNRRALERMEKISDEAGRRTLYAIFPVDPDKFSFPVKEKAVEAGEAEAAPDALSEYDLLAKSAAWQKVKAYVGDRSGLHPDLTINFELSWREEKAPQAVYQPKIARAEDDTGKDLTFGRTFGTDRRHEVAPYHDEAMDIRVRLDTPSPEAREIRILQGTVPIVAGQSLETVTLDDPKSYVGKDSTGIPALDDLGFKMTGFEVGVVKFKTDEGKLKNIRELVLINSEGERMTSSSSMTMMNVHRYDFERSLEDVVKAELEVMTGEKILELPFRFENVELP